MKVAIAEDRWTLREIETLEDAIKYGKGAGWCTAEPGNRYWDSRYGPYHGKLFILHAQWKKGKGQRPKYQLFQSWNNRTEVRGRGNSTANIPQLIEEFGRSLENWFKQEFGIVYTPYKQEFGINATRQYFRGMSFPDHAFLSDPGQITQQINGMADALHVGAQHLAQRGIRLIWQRDIGAHGLMLRADICILGHNYEVTQIIDDNQYNSDACIEITRHIVRTLEAQLARTYEMLTRASFAEGRYLLQVEDGRFIGLRELVPATEIHEIEMRIRDNERDTHAERLRMQQEEMMRRHRERSLRDMERGFIDALNNGTGVTEFRVPPDIPE